MRAARLAPPAPAAAPTTLRLQAQPRRPAPPRTCISRPAGARVDAAPSRATLPFAAPATSRAQQHHCSAQSRMCTGHSVRTLRCCAPQSGSRGSLPGLPWHWSTLFSHALKGWRPGVDWRVEDHVARATAEVTRLLAAGANPDGYKEVRAPRCRLPPRPFRALPSCAALTVVFTFLRVVGRAHFGAGATVADRGHRNTRPTAPPPPPLRCNPHVSNGWSSPLFAARPTAFRARLWSGM